MRIMYRCSFTVLLLTLFLHTNLSAQRKPGNEWINYSLIYYKINVVQNGIYRVKYSDLKKSGLNVTAQAPSHFKLYFRGAEVPIYTSPGIDTSDYFEFYGQGNDGALDSVLFIDPKDDINKSYSMFTDTAAYFLTIDPNSPSTARYSVSSKTYGNNPQSTYISEVSNYIHTTYQPGAQIDPAADFWGSDYIAGTGWMSGNTTNFNKITLNTPNQPSDTTNLPKPELEILVYGKSDVDGVSPDHHLVISLQPSGKILWDTFYNGYATIHKTLKRYWSDIYNSGSVSYGIMPAGVSGISDAIAISFIKLRYSSTFGIVANGPVLNPLLNFSYTDITGAPQTDFNFLSSASPTSTRNLVLYDLTNKKRTKAFTMSGLNASLSIDNFKTKTNYLLYDTANALRVLSINPVNFVLPTLNQNYIIVTNKKFASGAQLFADYKKTQMIDDSGNNFKPLIAFVDELYDQFFYGIHHPAAIQNFMAFLYNKSTQKPQYLMLLGKGIKSDIERSFFSSDYVPCIGSLYPGDAYFTSDINIGFQGVNKAVDPLMGVGRLQIMSNNDVLTYLQKLKEYDASLLNPQPYMKTAINVDGGDGVPQQQQIQGVMDGIADTLGAPNTGVMVNSYLAVTNVAVNGSLQTRIQNNIEQGTGLLTYLAHGSPDVLEIEIADTTTLRNKGRYPILYLNGCQLGNAGEDPLSASKGWSEYFTLAKDKGSIVWLSHSNQTLDGVLFTQMATFIGNVARHNYGKSIGSCWRKTINDLDPSINSDPDFRALCLAWELQGDPSVRFPYPNKPDYAVYDSTLSITPTTVVASAPTFNVSIPLYNLGKTDSKKIKIKVIQTLPDLTMKSFDTIVPSPLFLDSILFLIPRGISNIEGLNKFDVYVNSDSAVSENNYTNNHASFQYFFKSNSAKTLFPTDYGIVNVDTPALVSQSRNIETYKTGIYFEIDTTDLFNSPLKQKSPLLKGTNVITWKPILNNRDKASNMIDSTVYYWRARMNLPIDTGGQWETKSFVYLKGGSPGWSQSHWQQYKHIQPNQINIDTVGRKMSYLTAYNYYTLTINAVYKNGMGIKPESGFNYNGGVGAATLVYMEFDKNTLAPYPYNRLNGKLLTYDNNPAIPSPYKSYNLLDTSLQDSFVKAINLIPNGNYVLLISFPTAGSQGLSKYKPEVFKAFDQIGDTFMRELHDTAGSVAYVMAGQKESLKGNLISELYKYFYNSKGSTKGDTASITVALPRSANDSASIISELIGPATNWKTAFQVYRSLEHPSSDQSFLRVHGIENNGTDTVLFDNMKPSVFSIASINATKFPNLKLEALLNDTLNRTPPQLRLWQVEYDGLPEGSLITDNSFYFTPTAVNQGDSVEVRIKFQNISLLPMDSVLVKFDIDNLVTNSSSSNSQFFSPIKPGEYFWIDKKFSTAQLPGTNYLNINVNPNFQQPELTLDNNFIQLKFFVIKNPINPLLDVTFDGIHIADGQIVSPTPEIKVSVKEDNTQLPLNDTSDYKLTLQPPGKNTPDSIRMSDPKIEFIKGTITNNNAIVKYHPGPLPDGEYLFSAQATDISGNIAGPSPYLIHFKVVTAPAISNFYLYPNPLNDESRFVFTITGSSVPDVLEILIYDATGKQVKIINLNGKVRSGVNEYSWDGTNDNGSLLCQGIYLYKVIAQQNGKALNNFPLPEDGQLNQGYGKIIITKEGN